MGAPILVAHVMGKMMGGGVEATVLNHYRHIDKRAVQFVFVIGSDSTVVPTDEIESQGGAIEVVPPYKELTGFLSGCRRVFRNRGVDIVHSDINALSPLPLSAARDAGIGVRIAHSHSTSDPGERLKHVVKTVLRPFSTCSATHLAACSEVAGRWLFGDAAFESGRVHLVKNALELDRFAFDAPRREIVRRELGVDDGCLLMGQIGRLSYQKNQTFALDVAAELRGMGKPFKLVFLGDGPERLALEDKLRELGLGDAVAFLGVKVDVAAYYSALDLLLMPSTYEGLGMVAVEAQVSGLPVLASDRVPAEAEIVEGLVRRLPLGDAGVWAANVAARDVTGAADRAEGAARRCEELHAAGYDIEDGARELAAWYRSLLEPLRSNQ